MKCVKPNRNVRFVYVIEPGKQSKLPYWELELYLEYLKRENQVIGINTSSFDVLPRNDKFKSVDHPIHHNCRSVSFSRVL